MTYNLPIMTLVLLLVTGGPLAVAEDSAPDVPGNALVNAAVDSLIQQPALEAKIRQRATIYGQLLAGAGLYVQTRDANQLLVRFEFKLQVGDKNLSVLQINDGSTLWIRRDVDQMQSQTYVDLRRLREAATSTATLNPGSSGLGGHTLAIGGLAQLLRSLSEHFQFGPATTAEISGIPMWEVTGEWKNEQIELLLPEQKDRIKAGQLADVTQLPTQLPTTVKLTLGRDRNFPLFPYRIEYGRLQPPSAVSGAAIGKPQTAIIRPLVTMELYEVRRRNDLTPDLFKYSPGDQKVEDQTESFLQQLQLSGTSAHR